MNIYCKIVLVLTLGVGFVGFGGQECVCVDLGRQLFVDGFLIAATQGVECVYHHPVKYPGNPVLRPETPWEVNTPGNAVALPKGGGLWWDEERQVFRLWYEAGWCREICYAESADGIRWERPCLDVVPGTNRVLPDRQVDSWSVVPDPSAPPEGRWKLFVSSYWSWKEGRGTGHGTVYTSPDGIHWTYRGDTGRCGDRSTMYYDPFRGKWVWSLRCGWSGARSRAYHDSPDFLSGASWHWPIAPGKGGGGVEFTNTVDCVKWLAADEMDVQHGRPHENERASLYCFDAVAYESIMLGAFEIHWGPENDKCMERGLPKITEIQFCYSRDGRNFLRPDRTAAIAAERWGAYGKKWDVGYVQPLSNICVVRGDRLYFYYGAFSGDVNRLGKDDIGVPLAMNGNMNGIYANGAMGLAILRRDGFAGLRASATGVVTTRPLVFSKRRLFVNLDAPAGRLSTEVLDAQSERVLARLGDVAGDSTKLEVGDVSVFAGRAVRLRFTLERGELYSFWLAPDARGASGGYLAGGGPGYRGLRDL